MIKLDGSVILPGSEKLAIVRESPETLIVPYACEDCPFVNLEICDSCKWACTLLAAGGVTACPQCGSRVSHIPVTSDDVCRITVDENRGMVLEFGRRSLGIQA